MSTMSTKHFYTCSCNGDPKALGYLNKESEMLGQQMDCKLSRMNRLFLYDEQEVQRYLSKTAKYLSKYDNRYPCWELFVHRKALDLCMERLLGQSLDLDFGKEQKDDNEKDDLDLGAGPSGTQTKNKKKTKKK